MKPLVFIGQNGLANSVVKAIDEALNSHELIKVKFIDFKEKEQKEELIESICKKTVAKLVGMVGHVALFYRAHSDITKRKIVIPVR